MRRSIFLGVAATLVVASASLAATGAKSPRSTLAQAVVRTNGASSYRYSMTIRVARRHHPALELKIHGVRGAGKMFVHVRAMSIVVSDGASLPGPQESALLDGPFLYEGSPNGIAVYGRIRWYRLPVSGIGSKLPAVAAMRNLSPAPLLRVVDEFAHARTRAPRGVFQGPVAYDDAIVRTALSGMTGGIEFRDVRFSATVGADGYVHAVAVTGRTADGSRLLTVFARLYAFGAPVQLTPPGEGTFLDRKLLELAA
jgi:hypothetical protein